MQEPKAVITIRGKGEYFAQEERAEITQRIHEDDFVFVHVIVSMEYRGMTINRQDIVTVEEA